MICNKCGTLMVDQFSIYSLEHNWVCPNCNYNNMTSATNETPTSDFRSMNGIDSVKHGIEEQTLVRPEDCVKEVKFDYNPFKELREEFEHDITLYEDKEARIEFIRHAFNELLKLLEVTYAYCG